MCMCGEKMTRSNKAIKNSIFGLLSYVFITIGTFISRRIFANSMGAEYLGLMGLFTNILAMIALSEFGIWGTTIFYLYKPLAENDHEKIKSVLKFTKKMYNWIALVVFLIGIILTLFIDKIAHGSISVYKIRWYFLLSLMTSVVSYLYYYKQTLLIADQKNYVTSLIHTIVKLLTIGFQIITLIILKSFTVYLIIQIIGTILENVMCSYLVDKNYSYIKNNKVYDLDNTIKKDIFKRTKALFITKLSGFVVYSTDNIIISAFLNLFKVGIYSNYMLIVSMIKTLFSQIFSAFTSSFGDIVAQGENDHAYRVFNASMFFSFVISSIASVLVLVLSQRFIYLWLGSKYLLPFRTVCLITISLYTSLMDVPAISAQNATALHYKDQCVMILQIIVNIVLSLIFVKYMGIFGVVLANIISNSFLPSISKPYVIYKYIFKKSSLEYFIKYIFYGIITLFISVITSLLFNYLFISFSILSLIERGVVSIIVSLAVIFIFFNRTDEYKYCKKMILAFVNR